MPILIEMASILCVPDFQNIRTVLVMFVNQKNEPIPEREFPLIIMGRDNHRKNTGRPMFIEMTVQEIGVPISVATVDNLNNGNGTGCGSTRYQFYNSCQGDGLGQVPVLK